MTENLRSKLASEPLPVAASDVTDWDDEQMQTDAVIPLTREQAEQLFGTRAGYASRVTPFNVVGAQIVLSFMAAAVAAMMASSPAHAAVSSWFGGTISWLPGAVFALRLEILKDRLSLFSLVISEAVKITMTIVLLIAVAVLYPQVHWAALLITFVLTLKVYWLAMAFQ